VGANIGQERSLYAAHKLNVLWIEPAPDVFAVLQRLTAPYPRQTAIRALVTDRDDCDYIFYVSDNDGMSSSVFEAGDFKTIKMRCHKGKSTMSYIGALQVRKILEEIEKDPENAYPAHSKQLQKDLKKVEEELKLFLNEQRG
jgi:hypothetical protein